MRTWTVSTLCVFLSLICSPRLTMGQSNPNPIASSQNPPASTKSFELPRAAETGTVPAQTDSTNQSTNSLQSWKNLLTQQNGSNSDQLWSFKKGILPQLETHRCAHIVIFPAPDTDSEMIVEAPPGLGGNITTYSGLLACCRDLRDFHGLASAAPKRPLVQPPFELPKKNGQPLANFENWQRRLHP